MRWQWIWSARGSFIPAPREGFEPIPMWVADMRLCRLPRNTGGDHPPDTAPLLRLFRAERDEYFDAIYRLAGGAQRRQRPPPGEYRL
jgi:hypothetical protein